MEKGSADMKNGSIENNTTAKRRRFIINSLYYAIILCLIFLVFKYAINIIMPFVVAFLVAFAAKPIIKLLTERVKCPRPIAVIVVVILIYAVFGTVISLVGVKLFTSVRDWVITLPDVYTHSIAPALTRAFDRLEAVISDLGPDLAPWVESVSDQLTTTIGTKVTELGTAFATWAGKLATSVPGFLVKALITIVSSFFITLDYDLIVRFILRQFPEKTANTIVKAKQGLFSTIGSYLKSYILIMSITFVELCIGLSLVGVKNSLVVALVIAIFDILPVVGCGTVMVPWVIITLLQGDYLRALGLALVWAAITVIRNIIEPKIVGRQVGMHPVLVLFGMVVGTYFFGGVGLLGVPVSFALIKKLHDDGTIGIYKSLDGEDGSDGEAPGEAAPTPQAAKDKAAAKGEASEK